MPRGTHRKIQAAEIHGICARAACSVPFIARQRGQKYCTERCKEIEADKRYKHRQLDRIVKTVKAALGIKD